MLENSLAFDPSREADFRPIRGKFDHLQRNCSRGRETLRKTAEKLGANSYCGPWLLDQLPQIEQDIRSDFFPQITWAESRRIQDQHLANAKTQAEFLLKQAKDKADRMIQDAEKHSAQVRASLIRDIEKAIASL